MLGKKADINEIDLVKGCMAGNSKYQRIFFDRYYTDMMSLAMRYTKDADNAKDVVQDGFIKAFAKMDTFSGGEGSLKAWLYQIMVRTALDLLRKTKREGIVPYEMEDDIREELTIEAQLTADELMLLLNNLPDVQRIIFNLFVFEGFSHKEIGEQLGISDGSSKWNLCEARKTLKKWIEKLYPEVSKTTRELEYDEKGYR